MNILTYPENKKQLRIVGKDLTLQDIQSPDFEKIIQSMIEVLKNSEDGIGLAATQVGIPYNLFILTIDKDLKQTEPTVFLNSKIISVNKSFVHDNEGCLSFPGLLLKVSRPSEIKWSYQDKNLLINECHSTGFFARAVQHEVDHLNGRLMIDNLSNTQELKYKTWLKKI